MVSLSYGNQKFKKEKKKFKNARFLARLQTLSLGQIKQENFSLARGYLQNFMVLESSYVMCRKLRSLNFEGSVSFRKW